LINPRIQNVLQLAYMYLMEGSAESGNLFVTY